MATAVTAAVVTPTEEEEEEGASLASDTTAAMKSVLSKISETESLIPAVIPDGSKVISSLFGKLSKFAVQAPAEEDDEEFGWTGAAEDVLTDRLLESPRKKERCVSTNVFYEDVFPHGIRLGQLHSSLESYAAAISNGPIDGATLSLVSRHYRNGFQCTYDDEDFEGIDPDILQDILLVILSEDTALGLSLLLAHHQHSSDMFKSTPGLGLHLASIRAALQQSANDVFRIPPGLLYCWCKTLMYQNKLGDELFAKVLKEVETS
jgi:hypothetical protein